MNIFRYDFERRLNGTFNAVRQALINGLQSHGCKLDRVENNAITAHLGTPLTPRVSHIGKPPLTLRVLILDLKDSVQVNVQLADAEEYVLDRAAFERRYSSVFQEIQQVLDETLRAVDANMETPTPKVQIAEEAFSDPRAQLTRAVQRHTRGMRMSLPDSRRRLRVVVGDDVAILEPPTVDSLLAVSSMALSDPTIPQSLLTAGERIHAGLVDFVDGATGSDVVRLEPSDRRIFEFLYRQVIIRGALPLRELYHCLECDHRKLTNPEYQRELGKARLTQTVVGGVTSALTMGYMALLGTAARSLSARGSAFVCPQCQGQKAEVSLVTLCPGCKKLRAEPILRRCSTPGCGYDFMASAPADLGALWTASSPPAAARRPAAPANGSVPAVERPARRLGSSEAEPAASVTNTREEPMAQARRVRSVFVSCADVDADAVQHLVDGLRRMHYEVLLPKVTSGGVVDFSSVLAEIERCDAVLVALSPALLRSDACASERAYASRLGKRSIVVAIEDTDPHELPTQLASLPRVDFTDPNPASAFELADQLSALTLAPGSETSAGEQPNAGSAGGDSASAGMTPAGWYADPTTRHQLRWFDGDWSDYAGDNGITVYDPL